MGEGTFGLFLLVKVSIESRLSVLSICYLPQSVKQIIVVTMPLKPSRCSS